MTYEKKKEISVPFNNPIKEGDSHTQTWGCRQNNPNICANNSLPSICAFVTDDCICRKPSRAWKKQFNKLKGGDGK